MTDDIPAAPVASGAAPGDHGPTDYGHGDTSSELNAIARFKAMEDIDPKIKRKILSDNPRRFYGI